MNLKAVGTAVAIIGVAVAAFAGNAIARRSGFGAEGWLMAAFAFGILLLSQGPVLQLRQEVRDLRARLADRGEAQPVIRGGRLRRRSTPALGPR